MTTPPDGNPSAPGTLRLDARTTSPQEFRDTEWLLTSGHGAYAMGTAAGIPTRRYHGLLVGTRVPPVERVVALAAVVDEITSQGHASPLSSFRFAGGTIHPDGTDRLTAFEVGETARWTYEVPGAVVVRELDIVEGANRVTLTWDVRASSPSRLTVAPLVALRGFHELLAGDTPDRAMEPGRRGVVVRAGEWSLRIEAEKGVYEPNPAWWEQFDYAQERARGFDACERLLSPGTLAFEVPAGGGVITVEAALEPERSAPPPRLKRRARARAAEAYRHAAAPALASDPRVAALVRAADAFVVRRPIGERWSTTILAGYPWFADWGRDAMIALPGLLLTTGRFDDSREVLETFAEHTWRGLVPNRFDDYGGEPHYNTVDASLWFLHAAHRHAVVTGERDLGAGVVGRACLEIVDAYRDGTDFGIGMDPGDGLITAGDAGTQLTWMDAKTGTLAHTPRQGKAVEINALWVHGLRCVAELCPARGESARTLADRAQASFAGQFWNAERGCLYDHLAPAWGGGWRADASVRPNQIFAASLEFGPLTPEQRGRVVERVRRDLLTPAGLRTLAPGELGYRGAYEGGPEARDSAYHNGTAWPWLIGAYVEASLRAEGFSSASRERARRDLEPLLDSVRGGCLGQIAEVFDGDAVGGLHQGSVGQRRPGGCPAQAWSVAEVLRALVLSSA